MKDYEQIILENLNEAEVFFENQKFSDSWVRVRTDELTAIGLDNAPLFLEQIMQEKNVILSSYEAMQECMEDMMLLVSFPWDDKIQAMPIRYTALKTLCDRAGISGSSIMGYETRPYHSPITPDERASVLTMFLRHFSNKTLILVRDEKVSAVLSGDEKDYTIMPVSDLLNILLEELPDKYGGYRYLDGIASHEMVKLTFSINDEQMEEEIRDSLDAAEVNVNVSAISARLEFVTSDVGKYSATLIPTVVAGGISIRIGSALKLRHKGCSLEEFQVMCGRIFSMFEDGTKHIQAMSKIRVKNPEKVMADIATKADLPLRSLKRAQELMQQECGPECSGFEIYYYIYWIVEDHEKYMEEKGKALTLQQKYDMQEKASRQLHIFEIKEL